MSRDNWERLVRAVIKREELRWIAFCPSLSSSKFSADFSFDSVRGDVPAAASSSQSIFFRDVRVIQFAEIKKATNDFQDEMLLKQGRSGQVFKGWIDEHILTASEPGSGMPVAVKRWNQGGLRRHQDGLDDNYLTHLRHSNLVELVGHCLVKDDVIMVYEFMPNGSLDSHLFGRHPSLSWATRIKVATDAARGLAFLHEWEMPNIQRDFNTAKILLDGEFNAKLSNFWLGRSHLPGDLVQVLGTYGFIAHEHAASGYLKKKVDVYSFGVVLLELLTGHRAYDASRPLKEQNLVEWAKPYLYGKRQLLQIMDARLECKYSPDAAYKVAMLALHCLSFNPIFRPSMTAVVDALEQL